MESTLARELPEFVQLRFRMLVYGADTAVQGGSL